MQLATLVHLRSPNAMFILTSTALGLAVLFFAQLTEGSFVVREEGDLRSNCQISAYPSLVDSCSMLAHVRHTFKVASAFHTSLAASYTEIVGCSFQKVQAASFHTRLGPVESTQKVGHMTHSQL